MPVPDAQLESAPPSHGSGIPQRIPALDGARGLAVAGVVFAHSLPFSGRGAVAPIVMGQFAALGAFGVDLFFVLSGFLITTILVETAGRPNYFRNFYVRRILRLFPLYYLYLLLLMTAVPFVHHLIHTSMPDYHGNWLWYLTYFANWKSNHAAADPFLGHFWTLAVEEQFYLVWPLAVFLLKPRGRALAYLCGLLILSATVLRYYLAANHEDWLAIYRLTVTRWDTLAMGAAAALLVRTKQSASELSGLARILMICGSVGFATVAWAAGGVSWELPLIQSLGSTAATLFFAGLVLYAAPSRERPSPVLSWGPLKALGTYSYCIYVIHLIVFLHMEWLTDWVMRGHSPVGMQVIRVGMILISYAMVFFLAKASWIYFESPILRLKARFE